VPLLNENTAASMHGKYHLVKPSSVVRGGGDPQPEAESKKKSTTVSSKQKKYEKATSGTVKSQDSAATATVSLIQSSSSNSSSSSSPSPTPSNSSSTATASTSCSGTNKTNTLARLLVNKGTLQPFIDQFVEAVFANTANLPPVVQHLFAFLDAEIEKNQHQSASGKSSHAVNLNETERESLSRDWKVQCYFVKYWLSVLRRPDYVLDVSVNELVCSSLDCIVQALHDSMDAAATVQSLLYDSVASTASPTNRLLFLNDIPKYKRLIDTFFAELRVSSQPAVSDHELYFYLNEFSKLNADFGGQMLDATVNNQLGLNIGGACQRTRLNGDAELTPVQSLTKLYEVYERHEAGINAELGQQQCSILLPVHHRLVQIKELMSSGGSSASQHAFHQNVSFNNCATINRIYMTQPQQQQQQQQLLHHHQQTLSPLLNQHHGHHLVPPSIPPPNPVQSHGQSNQTNPNNNNNFF
jgi:hypothetical protein